METSISSQFLTSSAVHLKENLGRIKKTTALIDEEQFWNKSNEQTNSIGNLLLHLNGNITQYILSAIGGKKDTRIREKEFDIESRTDMKKLISRHERVVNEAISIMLIAHKKDLRRKYLVQGFEKTGLEIILHVVEHYSYHTGQVAQAVKLMKNVDLGFYKGKNLNVLNAKIQK